MLSAARRGGAWPLASLALALLAGCEPTNQGYQPAQPIVYSHAVHAGGLQIPCQYCHYAADRGRYAGIPPASVCMNCHTQVVKDHPEVVKVRRAIETGDPIEWVRVHKLPDHVAFNHSIHVNAEIACQDCHGEIQSMGRVRQEAPLTMGWCLDCHRTQGPQRLAQRAETVRLARIAAAADGESASPPAAAPAPPPGHARAWRRASPLTDCAVCHH